jgi:hypothetical protein
MLGIISSRSLKVEQITNSISTLVHEKLVFAWLVKIAPNFYGTQKFITKVIYEHGEPWLNDTDKGKLIHSPELSGNPTSKGI